MTERQQIRKEVTTTDKNEEVRDLSDIAEAAGAAAIEGDRIKNDIDDLLENIDDILETNAEEFVSSFTQEGGQ